MNILSRVLLTGCLASLGLPSAVVTAAPERDPTISRDVLQGIDAMRKLPVEGFHVVETHGRLLLVSTNGHYVVSGGRILDLWNQVEIHSVADVDATLRLPLAHMGIKTSELGGAHIGAAESAQVVTVFLDPGSPETQRLLPELRSLSATYGVDVVFVPAKPSRADVSRALICDPAAAHTFLMEGRAPAPLAPGQKCGEQELARARVTVHLLGIEVLPYTVAGNGTPIVGHPKDYAALVAANREPQS